MARGQGVALAAAQVHDRQAALELLSPLGQQASRFQHDSLIGAGNDALAGLASKAGLDLKASPTVALTMLSGGLIMAYNMWRTIRMPRAASVQADGTPAPRLLQAAV